MAGIAWILAKVVLARRARQQLLGLDWPLIDAVEDALGLLERDPHRGHPLRSRLSGLRSLRVGAYRIIYQLAENKQTVRVAAIRHRSIAYRTDPRSDWRGWSTPASGSPLAAQSGDLTFVAEMVVPRGMQDP